MTKLTKSLLIISLTGFVLGTTGTLWGLCLPIGAVFFGLFLISRVLEQEMALFDQEEHMRLNRATRNGTAASPVVAEREFVAHKLAA